MFNFSLNILQYLGRFYQPKSKHAAGRHKPTRRKKFSDKCRERLHLSGVHAARRELVNKLVKKGHSKPEALRMAKAQIKQGARS